MPLLGAWRAESKGLYRGGAVNNLYFRCTTGSSFPAGGRGNGLKGAILDGISGQGAEVYRLWE
jgi:hypothetical protein